MKREDKGIVMESPRPCSAEPEILMQGYLLKRGSRSKHFWHRRYFMFRSDNTLHYFSRKKEEDSTSMKLKGIFDVSNAEVSELFVSKHNKKLVYCVRLTFAASGSSSAYDESSSNEGFDGMEQDFTDDDLDLTSPAKETQQQPQPQLSPLRPREEPVDNNFTKSPSSSLKWKTSRRRRLNSEAALSPTPTTHQRNVSEPDLWTVRSSGTRQKRSINKMDVTRVSQATGTRKPDIPSLVEVDETRLSISSRKGDDKTAIARAQLKTAYEEQRDEEQEFLRTQYLNNRRISKKKSKQKLVQGTKLAAMAAGTVGLAAVTAGVGLMAGLLVFGVAAAGGGGAAVSSMGIKSNGDLIVASEDYDFIKKWKFYFDAAVQSENVEKSTWGQLFANDGRKTRLALLPPTGQDSNTSTSEFKVGSVRFENVSKWRPVVGGWASFLGTGVQGLRIYREEAETPKDQDGSLAKPIIISGLSVDGKPCAPVKAHVVLSTSALDSFLCLMSYGCVPSASEDSLMPDSERGYSFRVIEEIDDNADVIHLVYRPLFLFPSWTAPRDFVLYRYWRLEPDGSYVICYESVDHASCPILDEYVRGEMHKCFTIAPHKKLHRRGAPTVNPNECLMTAVTQVDPKGWVPTMPLPILSNQSYADAFGIFVLLQLLEIRDAIDLDRFVPVSLGQSGSSLKYEPQTPGLPQVRSLDSADETVTYDDNYDFTYSEREFQIANSKSGLCSMPPPLDISKWAVPDANSFRVRGKNYLQDKEKINAGSCIGRLVAVDVVSVDKPMYSGFSVHPCERIQLALQKEATLKSKGLKSDMPPFVFLVNICIPGPPYYHALYYYAVDDRSKIDGTDGTPSSKLCNEFFFGSSDEFRDRTFKLIPQIVQGNFIVRKAVGSTPAIMGKKLRQLYVRSDRFCEVVLDCGSSPVATGVIRLSLGYARTLVVDMGFLFEGDDETTLPERLFGCVRMKNMDFGPQLRHVIAPASDTDE